MIRKAAIAAAFLAAALLVSIAWVRSRSVSIPLGEASPIEFPGEGFSQSQREEFLRGEFATTRKVETLPASFIRLVTEQNGSRFVMADPGEVFEATDVISDASRPRRRLIFAGTADNRFFIHYEQGGRGHSYIIEFFVLASTNTPEPKWRGHCMEPSPNIVDLRSQIAAGGCT